MQNVRTDSSARYLACVIYRMLTKRPGSIAALPTSNKNDKNSSSITSNVEQLPWECNSLLQTRLETPNPKCSYAVQNKLPESFCAPQDHFARYGFFLVEVSFQDYALVHLAMFI